MFEHILIRHSIQDDRFSVCMYVTSFVTEDLRIGRNGF